MLHSMMKLLLVYFSVLVPIDRFEKNVELTLSSLDEYSEFYIDPNVVSL